MISLNAIGKDTRQTGDFCIWRPDGSGDNLLVIFKTSALLIIEGNEITVPPDSRGDGQAHNLGEHLRRGGAADHTLP